MERSESELDDQANKALEGVEHGTKWPGMSYEEGVQATLDWVRGFIDEKPMDDE